MAMNFLNTTDATTTVNTTKVVSYLHDENLKAPLGKEIPESAFDAYKTMSFLDAEQAIAHGIRAVLATRKLTPQSALDAGRLTGMGNGTSSTVANPRGLEHIDELDTRTGSQYLTERLDRLDLTDVVKSYLVAKQSGVKVAVNRMELGKILVDELLETVSRLEAQAEVQEEKYLANLEAVQAKLKLQHILNWLSSDKVKAAKVDTHVYFTGCHQSITDSLDIAYEVRCRFGIKPLVERGKVSLEWSICESLYNNSLEG